MGDARPDGGRVTECLGGLLAGLLLSSSEPSESGWGCLSHRPRGTSAPPPFSTSIRARTSCASSIGRRPCMTAHSPTSAVRPGIAGPAIMAPIPTSAEPACGFTRTRGVTGPAVGRARLRSRCAVELRDGDDACGDGGRERYGERLGSGGSPNRISWQRCRTRWQMLKGRGLVVRVGVRSCSADCMNQNVCRRQFSKTMMVNSPASRRECSPLRAGAQSPRAHCSQWAV